MALVALVTVGYAVIFVVLGAPTARWLQRVDDGTPGVAVDALLFGIGWLSIAITAWAWLSWAGLVVVLSGWLATAWLAWRSRADRPPLRMPQRPVGPQLALVIGWVVTLLTALLLRLQVIDFLPWIGDMGAYVNWANEFVRTGRLHATWPPLFSGYLSISTFLFGTDHTTIGVPLLGIALIVGVARLLSQLAVPPLLCLAAAVVLALHPHAVWYSMMPASESMTAPLFVLWLLLIHRATISESRWGAAGAAGVAMLAMQMLRGNALFSLVPLLIVALLATAVPAWRARAPGLLAALFASSVGAAVGVWYGLAVIAPYFVDAQLGAFVSRHLLRQLKSIGLLRAAPAAVAMLLLGLALVWLIVRRATRFVERRMVADAPAGDVPVEQPQPGEPPEEEIDLADEDEPRTPAGGARTSGVRTRGARTSGARTSGALAGAILPGVLLAVLTGGLVALGIGWHNSGLEVAAILGRFGWPLVYVAVVGLVLTVVDRRSDLQVLVLLLGLVAGMYGLLHADRLGKARTHNFFIYWDRYLVSEVLPILVILAALGVALAVRAVTATGWAVEPQGIRRRWLTLLAAFAFAAGIAVPTLPTLRLATEHEFLAGTSELTDQLVAVAETSDVDTPVVWSSSGSLPKGWVFPNTWMAFAVPMERSFGVDFVDLSQDSPFLPDTIVDAAGLETIAGCQDSRDLLLFETQNGLEPADQRLAGSGLTFEPLGTFSTNTPLLSQPPRKGWKSVHLEVTAWLVDVGSIPSVASEACSS